MNSSSLIGTGSATRTGLKLAAARESLFQQVTDNGVLWLTGRLRVMLAALDDTLFELAVNSASGKQENIYFDAMRQMRARREEFLSACARAFGERIAAALSRRRGSDEAGGPDQLDLPQEEAVALHTMSMRAAEMHAAALSNLCRLLDGLISSARFSLVRAPFGPEQLCSSCRVAMRVVDVAPEARLVLLKIFERCVLHESDELYARCAGILVDAGVVAFERSPAVPRRTVPGELFGCKSMGMDADLRDLIARAGPRRAVLFRVSEGMRRDLPRAAVVEALARLQCRLVSQSQPTPAGLRVLMVAEIEELMQRHGAALTELDEGAIALVSLLFETMLDDRRLSQPIRALIGRLELPFVRFALEDRAVFSRSDHPLRRLLNRIGRMSRGWAPAADRSPDPLFERIAAVVDTLVSRYEAGLSLVEELLRDLHSFAEREEYRVRLTQRRVEEAEHGKAMMTAARSAVEDLLESYLGPLPLPDVAVDFMREGWERVLQLAYLRGGPGGEDWRAAVHDLAQFVSLWSGQSYDLPEELAGRFREALSHAGCDALWIEVLLQGIEEALANWDAPEPPAVPVVTDTVAWEGVAIADARLDESPALRRVDRIATGAWFEFSRGGDTQWGRLATRLKGSGSLLFVDHCGRKIASHTRDEFAAMLDTGDVELVDDRELFDAALDALHAGPGGQPRALAGALQELRS